MALSQNEYFISNPVNVLHIVTDNKKRYNRLIIGMDVIGLRHNIEALGVEIATFTVDEAEEAAALWFATKHVGVLLQKSLQAAKRGFAAPVSVAQGVQ